MIIPDPGQTTTHAMRTDPTATDNSGGNSMTSSHTHGNSESTYALEITTVTYTAVDGADIGVTDSVNISAKGK